MLGRSTDSPAMSLELKILTLLSPTNGSRTMAHRHTVLVPIQTLSPSLHFDSLMLDSIPARSLLHHTFYTMLSMQPARNLKSIYQVGIIQSHLNSLSITCVHTVPQPVTRLVFDTPNPIHSGSSPILTCTVELSPAVDVPVNVTTVWTGPDGSTLTSATTPIMRSFTHYTSKAKLNYVEAADSGNYTCTVSIGGKIRASVGRKIVIGK